MAPTVRLLANAGATIGESPLWLGDAILWTDPVARRLLRFGGRSTLETIAVDRSLWSLAALPDGVTAGTFDKGFCTIDPSGVITPGPVARLDPGCRFNDMTTDASGGLWAGVMHRGILATRGAIYHAVSPDVAARRVAEGLGVPNGMKVSADGRTLHVIDTLARTLLAYPIIQEGLGEPVIVSDFLGLAGKPDGMTIAADGSFWVAMWGGGSVVQLAADGATLREIAVPASHVGSLCFAAPDRLLVTTSRMRLSPQALADHPGSGGLFEVRL
jgi:sugar lactone lactonase YvrE